MKSEAAHNAEISRSAAIGWIDEVIFFMNKKYWHELSDEEFESIPPHTKCSELRKLYAQPKWCSYPDAIDALGCWILINPDLRKKISIDYCKSCELFISI